ncbi:Hypothetical protein NTJ_03978 [Nesidiocoris tenuis]|uniref:CTNNB1 binding N-teminal domain-containing protein n=1 Tax=Nesidiocoris tenuis TaxID=355587 RepID=A0ABN7AJW9_9HEMI|nr:Hypothetical protein NTJ_03978 [Nesidiocoris tenuis]
MSRRSETLGIDEDDTTHITDKEMNALFTIGGSDGGGGSGAEEEGGVSIPQLSPPFTPSPSQSRQLTPHTDTCHPPMKTSLWSSVGYIIGKVNTRPLERT